MRTAYFEHGVSSRFTLFEGETIIMDHRNLVGLFPKIVLSNVTWTYYRTKDIPSFETKSKILKIIIQQEEIEVDTVVYAREGISSYQDLIEHIYSNNKINSGVIEITKHKNLIKVSNPFYPPAKARKIKGEFYPNIYSVGDDKPVINLDIIESGAIFFNPGFNPSQVQFTLVSIDISSNRTTLFQSLTGSIHTLIRDKDKFLSLKVSIPHRFNSH